MDERPAPKVVIVGAGFGGLAATEALAHVPVDVVLVDQHDYHTFQPLLYQVATALLNAEDVGRPVRGIFRHQDNVTIRQATVTGVDWETRRVQLDGGHLLPFDYLVLAAGSAVSYFGIPGAAEHAFPLYTLPDAVRLRDRVLDCFEAADRDPSLIDDGALTFVVVGGGPTGSEVAGALAEMFHNVLAKDYPDLAVNKARIVLVEMGQQLLPTFKDKLRDYARATLEERGVEDRLGEAVTEVDATRVRLKSGEELRAHTLIWAAGITANPLASALGLPAGKAGRIVVYPDLSVAGHPDVFVVGDLAQIVEDGDSLPQLAAVAMQSGEHAARQIARRLMGKPGQPFRYVNKGIMAAIGRGAAVAELPNGMTIQGRTAWFAWLGVHLMLLSGTRNRVEVLWDWGWAGITHERGARIVVDTEKGEARKARRTP